MNTTIIDGPGLERVPPAADQRRSIEDPNKPITAAALAELLNGGPTESGEVVTTDTALRLSAVYACVSVVSSAIARMPIITYERTEDGRVRAADHAVYELLRTRPNPNMSAFVFQRALIANVLLHGNGYAEIVRRGDGTVQALVPIESRRVEPILASGELRYRVTSRGGEPTTLLRRDILHVMGLTLDGLSGLSVIGYARRTLGLTIGAEKTGAGIFGRGLRPSGVLKHPGKLSENAVLNLRASLERLYAGSANSGRPMILEEGMEWAAAAISPEDAQFLETRKFQVEDICRLFHTPPHMIGHLERSTNNNIEQQSLDFLSYGLGPWVECCRQELNWKLFDEAERRRFYAEHLTQAIVLTDMATRGAWYERMLRMGAMTIDEVRERENLNRLDEDRGTVPFIPSNLMPAPTPEQADKLLEAWTRKASSGGDGGNGAPSPETDSKVAGTN